MEGFILMPLNSNYSTFERKIAFVLTNFPGLKAGIKKLYQRLNFLRYKKTYSFKSDYHIKKIGLKNKESYFGYYDKSPINSTNLNTSYFKVQM